MAVRSYNRGRGARVAAFGANRRFVRGNRAVTKLLKRMPDAVKAEMIDMIDKGTDPILSAQRADAPRRTGATAAALSKRKTRGGLRIRVGIIGRALNRRLFYARIGQMGRRAQTVTAKRRKPSGGTSSYSMRIRAMSGRPFVNSPRTRAIRNTLGGRLSKFWERALARAGRGVTDD